MVTFLQYVVTVVKPGQAQDNLSSWVTQRCGDLVCRGQWGTILLKAILEVHFHFHNHVCIAFLLCYFAVVYFSFFVIV